MYTRHFALTEKPFAITPDPRYLYLSERHADALAHLLYGINEAGGFIQLTGEVGTGKTTLVRALLERMPGHTDVAVVLNPRITPLELLQSLCQELHVEVSEPASHSIKALIDLLNQRLLAAHASGRRVVIIMDEAQNLSAETLEQVRLLTNLETASRKLLQIILIGQPELRDVLARSELRQLAQRITGRFHLAPLSRHGTATYIKHRLQVAGGEPAHAANIFTRAALHEVHRISHGIPRVINVVCDRALLGAYTENAHRIDAALVRRAAGEVYGRSFWPQWLVWSGAVAGILAIGLFSFSAWHLLQRNSTSTAVVSAPAKQTVATPTVGPAATPATPLAPQIADIQTLLNTQAARADGDTAFNTLLSLWGATYSPGEGRPCDQALQQGLECVYQKGSWGQLQLLNRPAILSLNDADGNAYRVVLTALNNDAARVVIGETAADVTLNSLSRDWLGEYLLLWRPQVIGQRSLTVGMRGGEVRWLRESLDMLSGAASTTGSDYYDEALAKRIEDFQRRHRLTVDGIAGVQTQIVLDSLVNATGTPQLSARANREQTS
jgi:general secretion pathway protein A